jgi:hypothetical protein
MIEALRAESAQIERSLGRIEGQLQSLNIAFMQHMQDDAANFKELKLNQGITQRKLYIFSGMLIAVMFMIGHADKLIPLLAR